MRIGDARGGDAIASEKPAVALSCSERRSAIGSRSSTIADEDKITNKPAVHDAAARRVSRDLTVSLIEIVAPFELAICRSSHGAAPQPPDNCYAHHPTNELENCDCQDEIHRFPLIIS